MSSKGRDSHFSYSSRFKQLRGIEPALRVYQLASQETCRPLRTPKLFSGTLSQSQGNTVAGRIS
jgi:hypothetical protein